MVTFPNQSYQRPYGGRYGYYDRGRHDGRGRGRHGRYSGYEGRGMMHMDVPGYVHEMGMMDMPPEAMGMPPVEGPMGGPGYVPPPPYPLPGLHAVVVSHSLVMQVVPGMSMMITMIIRTCAEGSDGIQWIKMTYHRSDRGRLPRHGWKSTDAFPVLMMHMGLKTELRSHPCHFVTGTFSKSNSRQELKEAVQGHSISSIGWLLRVKCPECDF